MSLDRQYTQLGNYPPGKVAFSARAARDVILLNR